MGHCVWSLRSLEYEESEANTGIESGKFNLKSQVRKKSIFLLVSYILEKFLIRREESRRKDNNDGLL